MRAGLGLGRPRGTPCTGAGRRGRGSRKQRLCGAQGLVDGRGVVSSPKSEPGVALFPTPAGAKELAQLLLHDGSGSASVSLTSFETGLLGCVVTAVIYVRIEKNLTKTGIF